MSPASTRGRLCSTSRLKTCDGLSDKHRAFHSGARDEAGRRQPTCTGSGHNTSSGLSRPLTTTYPVTSNAYSSSCVSPRGGAAAWAVVQQTKSQHKPQPQQIPAPSPHKCIQRTTQQDPAPCDRLSTRTLVPHLSTTAHALLTKRHLVRRPGPASPPRLSHQLQRASTPGLPTCCAGETPTSARSRTLRVQRPRPAPTVWAMHRQGQTRTPR